MMSVSLDGFFEGPNGELDWQLVDDELHRHFNDWLGKAGAFLDGRVTYELMAGVLADGRRRSGQLACRGRVRAGHLAGTRKHNRRLGQVRALGVPVVISAPRCGRLSGTPTSVRRRRRDQRELANGDRPAGGDLVPRFDTTLAAGASAQRPDRTGTGSISAGHPRCWPGRGRRSRPDGLPTVGGHEPPAAPETKTSATAWLHDLRHDLAARTRVLAIGAPPKGLSAGPAWHVSGPTTRRT